MIDLVMLSRVKIYADSINLDFNLFFFLSFRVLIPNQSKGESAMFINFIEIGHNHLLKHPLCESFLHLKWLKVRKFFFVSLMFHLLFTILQTAFVLQVYAGECYD